MPITIISQNHLSFGLRYFYSGKTEDGKAYKEALLKDIREGVLQGTYHYKSVRMFQIWDLLEEDPIFDDKERLEITNSLFEYFKIYMDAGSMILSNSIKNDSGWNRHAMCDALNLFVGACYFSRYYPEIESEKYLELADRFFANHLKSSQVNIGLIEGYGTCLEVLLEYAVLSGKTEYIISSYLLQAAERLVNLLDNRGYILAGDGQSGPNWHPYNLLRELTYLLKDGRYLYFANMRERAVKEGADRLFQFYNGQTYATDMKPVYPDNFLGYKKLPLDEQYKKWSAPLLSAGNAFDKLIGRAGFEKEDQYFVLNGIKSIIKFIPTVNSLIQFDQYGYTFLSSTNLFMQPEENTPYCQNIINVVKDGTTDPNSNAALLEELWDKEKFSYSCTTVCSESHDWKRHIFWSKNEFLLIVDEVRLKADGQYTATANWRIRGNPEIVKNKAIFSHPNGKQTCSFFVGTIDSLEYRNETRLMQRCDGGRRLKSLPLKLNLLKTGFEGRFKQHAIKFIPTLLHAVKGQRSKYELAVSTENIYKIEGVKTYIFGCNPKRKVLNIGDIIIEACVFKFDNEGLFFEGLKTVSVDNRIISASKKITGELNFAKGTMKLKTSSSVLLTFSLDICRNIALNGKTAFLEKKGNKKKLVLREGRCTLSGLQFKDMQKSVARILKNWQPQKTKAAQIQIPKAGQLSLTTLWQRKVDPISLLSTCDNNIVIGTETRKVSVIDRKGKEIFTFSTQGAPISSAWHNNTLYIGDKEGTLYCLNSKGNLLWKHRAHFNQKTVVWPWWNLNKPWINVIWSGCPAPGKRQVVAAGTGSSTVILLDAEKGTLIAEELFSHGLPEFILPKKDKGGKIKLLIGGRRLTPHSLAFIYSAEDLKIDGHYGRQSWDMTGIVDLIVDKKDVFILRYGTFNQLSLYEGDTRNHLWTVNLGGEPCGLCLADVDNDGDKEICTAEKYGWVCTFKKDGEKLWSYHCFHKIDVIMPYSGGGLLCLGNEHLSLIEKGKITKTTQIGEGWKCMKQIGEENMLFSLSGNILKCISVGVKK